MRKAYKSLISLAVVLIAGLNFIVPAFAQDPFTSIAVGGLTGYSGAGLFSSMASMSGVDLAWNNYGKDPVNAMWDDLNPDSIYISGEKHEADPQQYPEDIYDYIKVDIGDWLAAQSDFINELIDQKHITDNQSGTISATGSYYGVPFNLKFGSIPAVNGTYPLAGPFTVTVSTSTATSKLAYVKLNGNNYQLFTFDNSAAPYSFSFQDRGGGAVRIYGYNSDGTVKASYTKYNQTVVPTSNINWESGLINKQYFNGWETAKVKIPKTVSQLQSGWTLGDFLNELDRIWSGAGEDNIIIENGADVPPVPPTPIPTTPLGEVPFEDWVDLWGQGIYEQLENQSDALDFIGSNGEDAIEELESIDQNLQDLEETAETIDTNIGVGNGILGGIRSLAQSAVNYLEGIAEHVAELVEEIVEGTETLIAGILNQIPQAFSVIFGPIKQASSIWHYVVEWIQSIGAPFQFIWSMASGTSYYIILPVYASLAAAVVLAFYKRFGK